MMSLTSIKKRWSKCYREKFSHRSWQFRCPKQIFRCLLYDHLSAWQTVARTLFSLSHFLPPSFSVSLSFFAELICSSRGGAVGFWENICFQSRTWGLVTLAKDLESDCWCTGGILSLALYTSVWQCFEMRWAFTVERNKVPSPLRDRIFCPQSQLLWLQGQSMPGSRFGRT